MSLLWQISSSSIAVCYQVSNYIYQTIWQFCTLVYFCENGNNSVVLNLALYFVPCYLTSLIFSDCIWAGVRNIKGIATHPYRHVRYLNMYITLQILNVTGISLWSLAVSTAKQHNKTTVLLCCIAQKSSNPSNPYSNCSLEPLEIKNADNQEELDACALAPWTSPK